MQVAAATIDGLVDSTLEQLQSISVEQELASEVVDGVLSEVIGSLSSTTVPNSHAFFSDQSTVASVQVGSISSPAPLESESSSEVRQAEKLMGKVAVQIVNQACTESQGARARPPVDKSMDAVVANNRKRAEEGDAWAQARLGMRLIRGEGLEKDVQAGESWLDRSIAQGCKAAVNFKKSHECKKRLAQAADTSMAEQSLRERSVAMRAALNFRSLRRGARANFEIDLDKGFEEELEKSIDGMSQGMYTEALVPLKRCWNLRPNDPVVAYNLATCFALCGDMSSAFTWLSSAIKAGMDSVQLAEDPDYKLLFPGRRFAPLWIKARANVLDRQQSLNDESYSNVLRGRGRLPAVVGIAHEQQSAETRMVRRKPACR